MHRYSSLTILAFSSLAVGCGGTIDVAIPESALQAAVNEALPVNFEATTNGETSTSVTATTARVTLSTGDDRVRAEIELAAMLPRPPAANGPATLPAMRLPGAGLPLAVERVDGDSAAAEIINGRVVCRFGVRYEPADASIYCDNISIDQIEIGELPSEALPIVKRLVTDGLNDFFNKTPVSTLDGDDVSIDVARTVLQAVTIRDGSLILRLGL